MFRFLFSSEIKLSSSVSILQQTVPTSLLSITVMLSIPVHIPQLNYEGRQYRTLIRMLLGLTAVACILIPTTRFLAKPAEEFHHKLHALGSASTTEVVNQLCCLFIVPLLIHEKYDAIVRKSTVGNYQCCITALIGFAIVIPAIIQLSFPDGHEKIRNFGELILFRCLLLNAALYMSLSNIVVCWSWKIMVILVCLYCMTIVAAFINYFEYMDAIHENSATTVLGTVLKIVPLVVYVYNCVRYYTFRWKRGYFTYWDKGAITSNIILIVSSFIQYSLLCHITVNTNYKAYTYTLLGTYILLHIVSSKVHIESSLLLNEKFRSEANSFATSVVAPLRNLEVSLKLNRSKYDYNPESMKALSIGLAKSSEEIFKIVSTHLHELSWPLNAANDKENSDEILHNRVAPATTTPLSRQSDNGNGDIEACLAEVDDILVQSPDREVKSKNQDSSKSKSSSIAPHESIVQNDTRIERQQLRNFVLYPPSTLPKIRSVNSSFRSVNSYGEGKSPRGSPFTVGNGLKTKPVSIRLFSTRVQHNFGEEAQPWKADELSSMVNVPSNFDFAAVRGFNDSNPSLNDMDDYEIMTVNSAASHEMMIIGEQIYPRPKNPLKSTLSIENYSGQKDYGMFYDSSSRDISPMKSGDGTPCRAKDDDVSYDRASPSVKSGKLIVIGDNQGSGSQLISNHLNSDQQLSVGRSERNQRLNNKPSTLPRLLHSLKQVVDYVTDMTAMNNETNISDLTNLSKFELSIHSSSYRRAQVVPAPSNPNIIMQPQPTNTNSYRSNINAKASNHFPYRAYIRSLVISSKHRFRSIGFPGRPDIEEMMLIDVNMGSINITATCLLDQLWADIQNLGETYELIKTWIDHNSLSYSHKVDELLDFMTVMEALVFKTKITVDDCTSYFGMAPKILPTEGIIVDATGMGVV